ncbi:hypothetical protein GQX74_010407 [Glossina fuscipes]|nr:hypothetical protein GQX74_010407 [Glossina fuscipes]
MSGSAEADDGDDGDDGDDYDDDGDDDGDAERYCTCACECRISACLAAICHKMSPNVRWRKRQIPGNKEKCIPSLLRSLPPHMLHTYILIKRLKLFLEASFAHLYIVMLAVACLALKCIF